MTLNKAAQTFLKRAPRVIVGARVLVNHNGDAVASGLQGERTRLGSSVEQYGIPKADLTAFENLDKACSEGDWQSVLATVMELECTNETAKRIAVKLASSSSVEPSVALLRLMAWLLVHASGQDSLTASLRTIAKRLIARIASQSAAALPLEGGDAALLLAAVLCLQNASSLDDGTVSALFSSLQPHLLDVDGLVVPVLVQQKIPAAKTLLATCVQRNPGRLCATLRNFLGCYGDAIALARSLVVGERRCRHRKSITTVSREDSVWLGQCLSALVEGDVGADHEQVRIYDKGTVFVRSIVCLKI